MLERHRDPNQNNGSFRFILPLITIIAFSIAGQMIDVNKAAVHANSFLKKGNGTIDDDGCFKLCDVLICSNMLPTISNSSTFGLPGRIRNSSNFILPEKHKLFGETGNQIRQFFHAFDMAYDESATLVVGEEKDGFPMDTPLSDLYSIANKDLLESLGVTIFNDTHHAVPGLKRVKSAELYYHYSEQLTVEQKVNHRNFILQKLYNHLSNQMSQYPEVVDKYCIARREFGSHGRHVVIHSRYHFYPCLGDFADKDAAVNLPPDLIIDFMKQSNIINGGILMIHDGTENANKTSERLMAHRATSPLFTRVPHSIGNPFSDMMLAILSDVFIGNPSSTFAWYVAQVRFALGLGPSHIFYLYNKDDKENGGWINSCNNASCLYRPYCHTSG